ncbi:tetratricopeptide repeat protein [bacterium]|nr:tetratricopeptide repeat protein [bacterium]
MRKILSALFSIFVIAVIVVAVYFNQQFCLKQVNKVKGMYYVHKGDKAYRNLEMQQAIRFYNRGVKLFPGHYGAWYNLGNIYVAYEDYQSALNAYAQAFNHNPRMMIARMNYGLVSSQMLGDFDSALEQYQKIIKTKRKLLSIPYVFNNKISYKENKAIAYYNMGVTYRLKSLYAHDNYEKQRKYMSKAIRAYEKSIEIYPDSYDAQYNLGVAYHTIGDYERAGQCYCKAIHLSPMNYEAHYNLAVLLRRMRHYNEAYDEIDKATALITALDENPAIQEYVVTVFNEITRNVYQNPEYRQYLKRILEEEKRKTAQEIAKGSKDTKGKKDNVSVSSEIRLVNGKVVATDELDSAVLENFGQCPSSTYFDLK